MRFPAVFVLMAPLIVSTLHLRPDQFFILRAGMAGVLCHAVLIAASSVLILCNRKTAFLVSQAVFLGANLVCSLSLVSLETPNALAFALSASIGALVACLLAYNSLLNFVRNFLLIHNDGLFDHSAN